jgi:hypothetical protein
MPQGVRSVLYRAIYIFTHAGNAGGKTCWDAVYSSRWKQSLQSLWKTGKAESLYFLPGN